MVKHKLLFTCVVVVMILSLGTHASAQVPGMMSGMGGPLTDLFSVPDGSGLMFGVGSWGGYSIYGPYGIYDQYGLFGPFGLFGPSGPGYGSGLGFGGFGMHDPMELVKISKMNAKPAA